MKAKYILIVLCVFCATICGAQNSSQTRLFEQYAEMNGVTSIYISKAMFQLAMPLVEKTGLNVKGMENKIESLQILSSEKAEVKEKMRSDFSKMAKQQYVELMRVRDEQTRTIFYARIKNDIVKELMMMVDDDGDFTIIQLVGNFTLQEIQGMTKETK